MNIHVCPRPAEPGHPLIQVETSTMDPADWLAGCMALVQVARIESGSAIPASVSEYLDAAADALGDAAGALAVWRHSSTFMEVPA